MRFEERGVSRHGTAIVAKAGNVPTAIIAIEVDSTEASDQCTSIDVPTDDDITTSSRVIEKWDARGDSDHVEQFTQGRYQLLKSIARLEVGSIPCRALRALSSREVRGSAVIACLPH